MSNDLMQWVKNTTENNQKKVRKLIYFNEIKGLDLLPVPNLIKPQIESYDEFLQWHIAPSERKNQGLEEVFKFIFPIKDFTGDLILEYCHYTLGADRCKGCPGLKKRPVENCLFYECNYPERKCYFLKVGTQVYRLKHLEDHCRKRDLNFSIPLCLRARLIHKITGEVKEQDIFLLNMPAITKKGTFIIHGAERVIVSQLQRSPGLYFDLDDFKKIISSRIIPVRGDWLEFKLDFLKFKGYVEALIARKKKVTATVLLRALGFKTDDQIRALFPGEEENEYIENTLQIDYENAKVDLDNTDKEKIADQMYLYSLREVFKKLRPGEPFTPENAIFYLNLIFFNAKRYDLGKVGRYKLNKKLRLRDRIVNQRSNETIFSDLSGEILIEPGEYITRDIAEKIELQFSEGSSPEEEKRIRLLNADNKEIYILYEKDYEDLVIPKYEEGHEDLLENLLGEVLFEDFIDEAYTTKVLKKDIIDPATDKIIAKKGAELDDRLTSKLIEIFGYDLNIDSYFRKKTIRKILIAKGEEIVDENIHHLLNSPGRTVKIKKGRVLYISDVIAILRYLIHLSNGIGEIDDIDHLGNRRVKRCGEFLQDKFRASLSKIERNIREKMTVQEVEDLTPANLIHPRPINAAINEFFGTSQLSQFMDQTNPLSEITHKRRLSALGPGGLKRDRAGYEVRDVHPTHFGRICPIETPEGPNAGLIASMTVFSEINDYDFLETPYQKVKNGYITQDIIYMDAYTENDHIISPGDIKISKKGKILEKLIPVKLVQEHINEFAITDPINVDYIGMSPIQMVSLATALIPFLEHDDANRALMGTNMQRQAVPLLVTEKAYVGTGMEVYAARDSGYLYFSGETGVVDNVDAAKVSTLKDSGDFLKEKIDLFKFRRSNQDTCVNQHPAVEPGERLKKGDILCDGPAINQGNLSLGKNILVAFMSWKGYNFEDAILISERVVKDDVFTSVHVKSHEVEARDTKLGPEEITKDIPNLSEKVRSSLEDNGIIKIGVDVKARDLLVGKITPKGETEPTPEYKLLKAIFGEKAREVRNTSLYVKHGDFGKVIDVMEFTRKKGDELPHGVNSLVRVFLAQKRKLKAGDKMAGRHGNKGVVSRILPEEDMPFLPDGTPIDIVLNPLGVPSRMNLGQIMETSLGWAAHKLQLNYYTSIFNGDSSNEEKIRQELRNAELPETSEVRLRDGMSGDYFDKKILVGYMYMMKLHHLVDDKIHARSTGPYSLVTQQPLGGKAQFGGQRFGEMEVWALEAYGTAHLLQEMLTVKADDITGRVDVYQTIIKGEKTMKPSVPESFKVLVNELQSLGLRIDLLKDGEVIPANELTKEF